MSRSIRIYSFGDFDRSGKVRWTAKELGYEVEESRIDFPENQDEDYRSLNPYAQIPTAVLDGEVMIESTAICLILAERHPEAGLLPGPGPEREAFWQAIHVSTSTLEQVTTNYYILQGGHHRRKTGRHRRAAIGGIGCRPLPGAYRLIDTCSAHLRWPISSQPMSCALQWLPRCLIETGSWNPIWSCCQNTRRRKRRIFSNRSLLSSNKWFRIGQAFSKPHRSAGRVSIQAFRARRCFRRSGSPARSSPAPTIRAARIHARRPAAPGKSAIPCRCPCRGSPGRRTGPSRYIPG